MGGRLSTGAKRRHRGRDGDGPMDDARHDSTRDGKMSAGRSGCSGTIGIEQDRVWVVKAADSEVAAVVLGVGIEPGLSTAAQETGGTAWTATGRQV